MKCNAKVKAAASSERSLKLFMETGGSSTCEGHMDPVLGDDLKKFYGYVCSHCERRLQMCQGCGQTFKNFTAHAKTSANEVCKSVNATFLAIVEQRNGERF